MIIGYLHVVSKSDKIIPGQDVKKRMNPSQSITKR